MYYASPNFFGDEPVQRRGHLVREKQIIGVNGQNQRHMNHGSRLENQHELEHSMHHHEHKTKEKGKTAYSNHESDTSNNGSASTNQHANRDREDRDAILASRQTWGNQNMSGNQEGPEHTLATCSGDGARGSENQDPATNRRAFDYFKDASISQFWGNRVLKQLVNVDGHNTRSTAANQSKSPANESVLVFYEDGDHPQLHRLDDCAQLRASTLGQIDTPHHIDSPADRREEETVGDNGQSAASESHSLAACPELVVTNHIQALDAQHILDDCHVEDAKMPRMSSSVEICHIP